MQRLGDGVEQRIGGGGQQEDRVEVALVQNGREGHIVDEGVVVDSAAVQGVFPEEAATAVNRQLRRLLDEHSTFRKEYLEFVPATDGQKTRDEAEELEEMVHYTGDYLNRIVRRKSGMSLVELGRSISLEEAAVLLRDTDDTVAEIMQILGYSNRTYFYRIFRQKYGLTPKEYREQPSR